MKIRSCYFSDLPCVIRIERASFGPDSYSITNFLAHVFRDRKGLIVAEDSDGSVVGYILVRAGLRWLGVRRGGITSVAVHPAHRRRGVGRALLAAALDYLGQQGVEEADLEVNVQNRAAQSLYQSFGFVQTRLLPHYYAPDQHGIKMNLEIQSKRAHTSAGAASSKSNG